MGSFASLKRSVIELSIAPPRAVMSGISKDFMSPFRLIEGKGKIVNDFGIKPCSPTKIHTDKVSYLLG